MNNSWQCFKKQSHREILIQLRQPKLLVNAFLFFLMIMVFFPLTMPANPVLLKQLAPGLIWMSLLLSIMLSSERLFQQDYDDGIIEQWLMSGSSIFVIVLAKVVSHWLLTVIPLLFLSPLIALLFNFSYVELVVLIVSLLAGTPAIICLSTMAAAFSSGMQQKGIFMALILLPLTVPILIFGSGLLLAAMQDNLISGYLALLLALSTFAMSFLPFAITAVIEISLAD
jgi:heme exporter protein B